VEFDDLRDAQDAIRAMDGEYAVWKERVTSFQVCEYTHLYCYLLQLSRDLKENALGLSFHTMDHPKFSAFFSIYTFSAICCSSPGNLRIML
jgi:hypothetical protein